MADEPIDDVNPRPRASALLPLPLRNWQVLDQPASPVEIDGEVTVLDGEATVVDGAPVAVVADTAVPEATPTAARPAMDQIDDALIVSIATRAQQIEAGATATYEVTLLNNGAERALFTVRFAESRLALWLSTPLPGIVLQPGERALLPVALTPPRAALSRAGDYRLTFVVEADAYPQRQSQVVATLTILPFVELKLGKVTLPYRTLTWWRRSVTITAPLFNSGNLPTPVGLRAQDGAGVCHIALQAKGLRQTRQQQAQVTAQPGRITPITLQVYAQSQVWFGRTKRICPIQLTVTTKAAPPIEQTALIKVLQAPAIGPWQVATLVGLCAMVVTGLGLGGLAILAALIVRFAPSPMPAQSLSPAAPPAIVTILVQPAPVRNQPTHVAPLDPVSLAAPPADNAPNLATTAATTIEPEVRDPAVPLIQADQISTPAGAVNTSAVNTSAVNTSAVNTSAVNTSAVNTSAVSNPVTARQDVVNTAAPATETGTAPAPTTGVGQQRMTYAQMFQEIGLRYDLNWRMLAAQAYEESSFDSLALGSHGDLGLMQIRPSTWREWAPTVAAADPFDSYSNVLVAAAYLDYLRTTLSTQGHTEREWMLVAYNWGPDKVLQHLANGGTWADLSPELQHYVEDILRLAETIPPDAAF